MLIAEVIFHPRETQDSNFVQCGIHSVLRGYPIAPVNP